LEVIAGPFKSIKHKKTAGAAGGFEFVGSLAQALFNLSDAARRARNKKIEKRSLGISWAQTLSQANRLKNHLTVHIANA